MDHIASFGYWVRRRRKALDLTQAALAKQVGCSAITIRKIERDERRPSQQIADLLAEHLAIPGGEQSNFIRMARGEFIPAMVSPLEVMTPPSFIDHIEAPADIDEPVFVAREVELTQLDGFLDLALSGQGRVVFVIGEAGRGKTALISEFARHTQEAHLDLIIASGNCNAYTGSGDPYLPFREILDLLTGNVEARWAAGTISKVQAERLWRMTPRSIQAVVNSGPDLIDIFISSTVLINRATLVAPGGAGWRTQLEELAGRKATAQNLPNLQQRDLFEQYARVLEALAQNAPLLLIVDDLQWADAGSLELLFHLGRRVESSKILIVGLYRPAEVALGRGNDRHPLERVVNEFQRRFGNIHIDLSLAEGRRFTNLLINTEPNRLTVDFREALYQHTDGHALFTIEMLRGLQERGDLVRNEIGQWVEGPAVDWKTLPPRVEGVIGERIGRLPLLLQDLLKVSSIEGEVFTAEVVAQVQGIDDREIVRLLSGTVDKQHRLVQGQGSLRLDPGGQRLSRYRFRHILFQRYLYDSLDEAERSYLHEAVGQVLEQLYTERPEAVAGRLAWHFLETGLASKATGYLRQAGDQAQRLVALEEAISYYHKALDQWPTEDEAGRAETLRRLGECLIVTGPLQEALEIFEAGFALFETLNDQQQAGAIQRQIGRIHWLQGDRKTGLEHYHQALAILKQGPESAELARAISGISQMHMLDAEFDQAITWGERALALAERLNVEDVLMHALNNIGVSLFDLGNPDRGLTLLLDSRRRALKLSLPYEVCRAYYNAGYSLLRVNRYREARATFEELYTYAITVQAVFFAGFSLARLVELDWLTGHWAAALARRPQLTEWMNSSRSASHLTLEGITRIGWIQNDVGQAKIARRGASRTAPGS